VVIAVGGTREEYAKNFAEVVEAARLPPNPWVMPYEDELAIFVARGPRRPIDEIWPSARHYE
jgi:hypothetical protein